MTAFRYKAIDAKGKTQTGVLESDSPKQVRAQLRERNLLPVAVEAVHGGPPGAAGGSRMGSGRGSIGTQELALITRQFATLLQAGLTIEQGLNALIEQSESPRAREVLAGVRSEVLGGHNLAGAFRRYGRVFPELYHTIVHAGEQSGQLSAVMLKLADYLEARQALRAKVMQALIYPAIVTLVALAVVFGLMTYVVPQVVEVFQQTRQGLPLLTRVLISVSDFMRATWWLWLAVAVAGGWSFALALRKEAFRLRWHATLLRMPLVGRLTRTLNTARFASTLSILAGSGVPVLQALETGAQIVSILPMRRAVQEAASQVREGASLSAALKRAGQFPPVLVHLIASGEATGQMEKTLDTAARQQELEVTTRLGVLTSFIEPALIVGMGGIVLMIVLAVLMPIIEMNQLVK